MLRKNPWLCTLLTALFVVTPQICNAADTPSSAQLEFFETRIRPVLVEQCYECHNSAKTAEGGLAVDSRSAFLKGGDSGVTIAPGRPADSRLLAILRHEVDGVKMPQGKGKLSDRVIADFEKWIAMGAIDPRDKAPTAEELTKATSWDTTLAKRKLWWSFQPIRKVEIPAIAGNEWSEHPIDRFVLAKLREKGLQPSASADPRTLVRRLYFALIGLPPTVEEVTLWTAKLEQPKGFEELVEHLLGRPQFGERWARHWMDWLRYAESHGSEGDPAIDNIWRYRDYLVRALNADVPYDQLVREHIAGDLLQKPRLNQELGINESMVGPAHWRMVFHGFAPTDPLDEKVRFIDDEINTFSKAFLGLTVSCARCHDHKFDAISQKDYYALFGILGSCRPGRSVIDAPDKLAVNRDQLTALKPQIRAAIATAWLDSAKTRADRLVTDADWKKADNPKQLLHTLFLINKETQTGVSFAEAWKHRIDAWTADRQQRDAHAKRTYWRRWNLSSQADYATWFHQGNGLSDKPTPAGEFSVTIVGENALAGIYPAGIFSNRISGKDAARLTSRSVHLADNYELWLRTIGEGGASARYVVQDYPRDGTVFPVRKLTPNWQWEKLDLTYWNGDDMHIEFAAGKDAPLMVSNEPRSWFGVREAVIVKKGDPTPPVETQDFLDPLFELTENAAPQSMSELSAKYAAAISAAVQAWKENSTTDAQASLLDMCLKQGLLSNRLDQSPNVHALVDGYRQLEAGIVTPTRVPGLEETVARDQPLLERGDHKHPGAAVPRRFLEAIDPTPYQTAQSGRLQLAENLLRPDNPFTRRVIVNRLWHHLIGRGIVATPDNFGRLGIEPTHPELLDFLATRFSEQGWSIKDTVRFIVTSRTWQQASHPSELSQNVDPDNQMLSHAFVKRLEAEAIRDALLTVSGKLEPALFGGPEGGRSNRRSLYVGVNRNSLDPFLRTFDFPEPFSTVGRRDLTNVPAQSLTMLNDERVAELASEWARRVLVHRPHSEEEPRIQDMFVAAFGRPASQNEVQQFKSYVAATKLRWASLLKEVEVIQQQIDLQQTSIRTLIEPVRSKLLEQAKAKTAAGEQIVPQPIGRWEFEDNLKDAIGTAHGEFRNGARIEAGMLAVNQQGHVITAPLQKSIKQKTLEAWVQLDNLDQRGGGVMTIQTPDGVAFDAIVFGEQNPRQWIAGSDGFVRTQSFDGPQEQEATGRAVHIAIAYHDDGRIIGYRDGQSYGKAYRSNGPHEFKAGNAVIGFGIRHLPAGGNRMLSGRILRAQLYDRALSADEIQATSRSAPYFVTESQILAALTDTDREQIASNKKLIKELEAKIQSLGTIPDSVSDQSVWTEVARAMFTFKEFIYIR
jgi:hypothetical protein